MGTKIRVFLTPKEYRALRELHKAKDVPQRIKNRAQVVRMNAGKDYKEAELFQQIERLQMELE